ncbi:MAG: SDR family oxidoreductase [Gammaproteobacteria bacterium]|nr:SDR family oxidoreductase [Gammaproteobacteria bacterium]
MRRATIAKVCGGLSASLASALIIGCGDLGCRLALRLQQAGHTARGVVRGARGAAALSALGIQALVGDVDAPLSLPSCDWVYYLLPPAADGETDSRLRRLLANLAPPARLVYLSTSGVYGDAGGRWIDEREPPAPVQARARRRLDAERAVIADAATRGYAALVVRAPGIYGPGRLPVARLTCAGPIARSEESPYSNRIHADDLAAALRVVAERGAAGAIYNASDGAPTTMSEYLLACAAALGLPPPPQRPLAEVMARASPMQREFLGESKRLRNDRLRSLGWTPRYCDLHSGLPGCLQHDTVAAARAGG